MNREISGPSPEQGVQHTRLVLRTCKDTVRNVLDIKKPSPSWAISGLKKRGRASRLKALTSV